MAKIEATVRAHPDTSNGPRCMPVYKGWTVDERLQEFRAVFGPDGPMQTVPFDSIPGRRMLAAWRRSVDYNAELARIGATL